MTVDPTTLRAFDENDNLVNLPPYPSPTGYDDSPLLAALSALRADFDADALADAAEDAAQSARLDQLQARLADLQALPDDDVDDEARAEIDQAQTDIAELKARPTGTGTGASFFPGRHFNSFGANDNERMTKLLAWEDSLGGGSVPYPQVWFDQRVHRISVRIPIRTSRRWIGVIGPVREFSTGTVIQYVGASGTSLFYIDPAKNTGYGYPAGGVPRDSHYIGIQWNGGLDVDFLPLPTGYDAKWVLWYCEFENCGWQGWRNNLDYYGTGLNITGTFHLQAYATTPIKFRGSENELGGGMSLADTLNATFISNMNPIVDFSSSKSVLGTCLLSARRKAYSLKVSGGHNSHAIGAGFDGPAGNFMENGAVRFDGSAIDFGLQSCSFKGISSAAIMCVTGPTQVDVQGCSFKETAELARCESAFNGVLLWGLNKYEDVSRAVIRVARGKQVINLDPRVTVMSLDGLTAGIRNPDGTYTSGKKKDAAGVTQTVAF
jgi:hypothetical protein